MNKIKINYNLLLIVIILLAGFYFIPFKSSQFQPASVIYPNGGETLEAGQTYEFSWTPDKGVLKIQLVSEKEGEIITFYTVTPIYNAAYGRYFGDSSGSLVARLNPFWFNRSAGGAFSGGGLFRLKMIFDDDGEDISDQPFTVVVPETSVSAQPVLSPSFVPTPMPVKEIPPVVPVKKASPVTPKSVPQTKSEIQIPVKQTIQPVQSPEAGTKMGVKKEEKTRVFSKLRSLFRSIFGKSN